MSFTNAQLALKISQLIKYWASFNEEYASWLGGVVGGGPGTDGKYPLTDYTGGTALVSSPAQLEADVTGLVDSASTHAGAAAASAAAASASASTASTQAGLADAARIAAETAATTATTKESSAVNAAVTATAQSNLALTRADNAAASETNAATSETNAAASELAAAASAAAAATFDPSAYRLLSVNVPWADLTGVPSSASRWPTYAEVTGKPTTFAPSAHTHVKANITDFAHTHLWADLTDKPTTFAPSAHGHAWADLSGVPSFAARWPTWAEVTSKPTTFAPSAHSHDLINVYDCRTMPGSSGAVSYFPAPNDSVLDNKLTAIFSYDGLPDSNWGGSLVVKGWGGAYAAWSLTARATTSTNDEWYLRSGINVTWGARRRVWHDGNFNTEGLAVGTGVNNGVNQIVRTDGNGYIQAGWINTVSGNFTGAPTRIMASNDAYLRYMTPANFRAQMKTPQIFVQSATPSGQVTGDLWIW